MLDIVTTLKDTPFPNILVAGGILFLLLAVAGQIAGKIEIPAERQKRAGIIGTLLLVSGVLLHVLPKSASTPATAGTGPPPPTSAAPASIPASASIPAPLAAAGSGIPTAAPSAIVSLTDDCFAQYVSDIAADRVKTIEMGTVDFQVIAPNQPKDGVIGIKFTELNQAVAGMRFFFIPGSNVFKIETVVDAQCQAMENYANASRGGDKRVLQNWDSLQMRLGDQIYTVSLAYDSGEIGATTQHISP